MELQQFLEEQEQVNHEHFKIDNDSSANWALRKIKSLKEKQQSNASLVQDEVKKINAWLEEENKKYQQDLSYFEGLLAQYVLSKREEDPKFKTLKLPHGKISFKKQQAQWNYDDSVIQTLKDSGRHEFIRVKEEINKAAFKKAFSVAGNVVVDASTGEIIPGVTVEEREDQIKVEVE